MSSQQSKTYTYSASKIYLGYSSSIPEGWGWASLAEDAIQILGDCEIAQIQIDSDAGFDVLKWIENEVLTNAYEPPIMTVGNKVGDIDRKKMESSIQNILRLYEVTNMEYEDDGYDEIGKMRDYD